MTLSQVVDGVTDLDSALFNPIITEVNTLASYDTNRRQGVANVLDYGAVGDGSTNDASAIQAAIDSGASKVVFPAPSSYYKVQSTITPKSNQLITGSGLQYISAASTASRVVVNANFDGPVFTLNSVSGVTIDGLLLTGTANTSHTSNVGINAISSNWCAVRDCAFNNFAGPAIKWISGVNARIERCLTTNCVLLRTGYTDHIGVFDINGTDHFIAFNEVNASCSGVTTGYLAACVIRNANNFLVSNIFEVSEIGLVLDNVTTACFQNVMIGNRADLNYGHGFVVEGSENQFIGNRSYRNGRAQNNTYDGFVVTGASNQFLGNSVFQRSADSGTLAMRYGFNDSSSTSDSTGNIYIGNRVSSLIGTSAYNVSDTENQVIDFATRSANADTSGATLGQLENEVNEIKALLRTQGLLKA